MIRIKDPQVARWFASTKHAGQMYGQQPYIIHLDMAVDELHDHILGLSVLRYHDHDVLTCATFLHDTLEDTEATEQELRSLFVEPVVDLVMAVTDRPGKNRAERKAGVYRAIRGIGVPALAVKCADRLGNAKVCGLAKGESDMLKMYRKEQPTFEDHLRPFAGVGVNPLPGFGPVFKKIREYLGLDPLGGVYA